MRTTLHVAAAVVLYFAAFISFTAWAMETCTGNAPDALLMGIFVLPLNAVGGILLAWRPNLIAALMIALVPVLVAISYVRKAIQLLVGTPACNLVTNEVHWPPTGDETLFGVVWLACALVLAVGIVVAASRGYRALNNERDND